jgi:uncharacterized protein (TIRG00374 family)
MLGTEKNVRLGRATISFVVVKMVDLVAVLFFLLGSMLLLQPLPEAAVRIFVVVVLLALLVLAFFIGIVLFRRRFASLLRIIAVKLSLDKIKFIQRGLELFDNIAEQSQEKIFHIVLTTSILSLLYMLITMGWGYARLRMFSLSLEIEIVTFVHAILQVVSWIPVLVLGGLGISETISVYLFSVFGETQAELAAVLISARLIFYLMNAFSLLYLPVETVIRSKRQDSSSSDA